MKRTPLFFLPTDAKLWHEAALLTLLSLSFYLMFIQSLPPGSFSFPSTHPQVQKAQGACLLSYPPFHLITPLSLSALSLFFSSPSVKSCLQGRSLGSQHMSTNHLNSFEKGRLVSPWPWAVLNPNGSVCFPVPRPVRVGGSKAFAQWLLESLTGIFKDLGSGVSCPHPLMLPNPGSLYPCHHCLIPLEQSAMDN